ncbi:MAG: response regulator [Myxococcaceae bacterium]|nr:response regulator [Myxococcaceae bacterium]
MPFTPPHRSTPLDPRDATVIVSRTDTHRAQNLARHLRADGFKVVEARDPDELVAWCKAYTIAEARLPDVVISDDLKPVEQLRRDGQAPPFILLTRTGDWRSFVAAERAGAAYVFETSPDDGALRSAVFALTRAW